MTNRSFITKGLWILSLGIVFLLSSVQTNVYCQTNDNKELELFDFANGLFQRGLYDMALTEYERYLAQYDKGRFGVEAHFGVAESLFFKDDYTRAIAAYEEYIRLKPGAEKEALARLRIGQTLFFSQQYDKALETFKNIKRERLDEESSQTLDYYWGRAFYQKGQLDQAIEYLSAASKIENEKDTTAQSFLLLGDIFLEQKSYAKAQENYQQAYEKARTADIKSLALFKKGEAAFLGGQSQEAVRAFRLCVQAFPDLPIAQEAFVNLLKVHLSQGQYKEVIQEFAPQPGPPEELVIPFEAFFLKANAFIQLSQYDQAIKILDESLGLKAISPEDKEKALLKKTEVLIKTARFQEALDLLQSQLNDTEAYADKVFYLKAESFYGLGQLDKAQAAYRTLIKDYPDSDFAEDAKWAIAITYNKAEDVDKAIISFYAYYQTGLDDVKRSEALYNVILLKVRRGQIEEAIQQSKDYFNKFKQGAYREKVLFLLANLYQKTGQYEEAIRILNKYIETFGSSERLPEVYFLLGYNNQLAENPEQALEAYRYVLARPADNNFYYPSLKNSASVYLSLGQEKETLDTFERIVSEFKDNDLPITTFFWMAEQYLIKGRYDDVLSILDHIQEAGPAQKALMAYLRAEAYRGKGDNAKAIEQYDLSLSIDENGEYSASAHLGRGLSLKGQGQLEEASQELQSVIENNPDAHALLIQARMALAEIEELKGNDEEAVKYYMLVAILYDDPDIVPQALYQAGQIFEKQNKKEDAVRAYQELIKKYKQSRLVEKAEARLQQLNAHE